MWTAFWVLTVWFVLFAAACTVAFITARKANRVVPGVRTTAPMSWLVSPSRPARLHRQLRSLGTWASHAASDGHADTWSQIVAELVTTDARLVVAARANTRVRPAELDAVAATAQRLEDLAVRLRHIDEARHPDTRAAAPSDALELIEHRITNLEQAHADLADLERRFATGAAGGTPTPSL